MSMTAGQIMSRGLKTIGIDVSLGDALEQIKTSGRRHLVVVDARTRKLLGLISDRDIKKIISPFVGTSRATQQDNVTMLLKVEKIMVKKPYAVMAADNLKSVIEKMLEKKIGSAIVVDESTIPIGIITRTDILKTILNFL